MLVRMENPYPMGDTDRQGNLMMPAMAATNGVATGVGKAGVRIGTGVSTVVGAGGGGADGGNGGGGYGMMEFGGMLNADGDGEDTSPEPRYVFSVPHWETVKAGVSSFFPFSPNFTAKNKACCFGPCANGACMLLFMSIDWRYLAKFLPAFSPPCLSHYVFTIVTANVQAGKGCVDGDDSIGADHDRVGGCAVAPS